MLFATPLQTWQTETDGERVSLQSWPDLGKEMFPMGLCLAESNAIIYKKKKDESKDRQYAHRSLAEISTRSGLLAGHFLS